MSLVPMAELLAHARSHGYAVPAFCVWNLESTETVLKTVHTLRAPVILMHDPGEFNLIRPARFRRMVNELMDDYPVPTALHLDHGHAMEHVQECLEAGFSSVMLDYSTRPFAENAAALREVVQRARPLGITVEGEIGHVGRGDTVTVESAGDSTLTTPEEAAAYVEETGVDALAVSIGNAHGAYTRLPRLDFDRLAAIRDRVSAELVLHGGSGTPEEDLKRAISLGITKVNVATELVTAYRESLREQWAAGRNLWAPVALIEATQAVAPVVARWTQMLGAAGQV
jgi:ketose-bisphosphate aldolase